MEMFCYQCEQTSQGSGCTTMGICGKSPETTLLQDLIVYQLKGISQYAHRARIMGVTDKMVNFETLKSLFMTLTNVNFDASEHYNVIRRLGTIADRAQRMYEQGCRQSGRTPTKLQGPASWRPALTDIEIGASAQMASLLERMCSGESKDVIGLQELLTYGVKGLAAYAHHAELLGYSNDSTAAFVHSAFDYLTRLEQTEEELLALCLEAGEVNFQVMELLDKAHNDSFGHPQPTQVRITPIAGKCILISGHDLKSCYELLKQTEGTGVNVFTHGELLPAHGYPVLKRFTHLAGNYGGAWQLQQKEFEDFPGPIVMTTNCLKPPADSYKNRLFTMDAVGFEGVRKIEDYDYSEVLESALNSPGYTVDSAEQTITVGFGHDAVLGVADQVIDAVKTGAIRHFFLVGGCDGAEFARNYYTELTEKMSSDCVIMTLGCAKFRFNKHDFGAIGGIPRLLDLGQCNDSYSAIKIALALSEAFGCSVNELPLSLVLSWFEQKAVAVLLTLLHLGIKNISIGPNLPAFITPTILDKLVGNYGLRAIGNPEQDLQLFMRPTAASAS